jgi:transposase InsO family protein
VEGLKERSRAPHHCPNATSEEIKERIVQAKLARPHFGPKKIMDFLRRNEPEREWPADSTAGEILKQAGLVKERRRRRRVPADSSPFKGCDNCNRVWSADFKGHFRLGNGRWCYPLTVTDNYSRYLLACRGLYRTTGTEVRPWFEWVFRTYGLPEAIRTDNGSPFASRAVGGISSLSKWWIQLDIKPERIETGKPSQNGRHERMHRSLKEAVTKPPKKDLSSQQCAFHEFTQEYNEKRSHEGIGRKTPSEVYVLSQRNYPMKLRPIEYDTDVTVRSVRHNGEIKWRGNFIYITDVLAKERIGLKEIDEGRWAICYSFHPLGTLNEETMTVEPCCQWHGKVK